MKIKEVIYWGRFETLLLFCENYIPIFIWNGLIIPFHYFTRLAQSHGGNAASLTIAEQYVHAFNKLASVNNTLIIPSNVGDISSLVGQAMTIYDKISNKEKNEDCYVKENSTKAT